MHNNKKNKLRFAKKDHAQFVRTIMKNPDDPASRGAYADYLEENGLHHDQKTLSYLRGKPSPISIRYIPKTDKVVVGKDHSDEIKSDPWNPKHRIEHARYHQFRFKNTGDKQSERIANHNREFSKWLKTNKPLSYWNEHHDLANPDFDPNMAQLHLMATTDYYPEMDESRGFWENPIKPTREVNRPHDNIKHFRDGSSLYYHASDGWTVFDSPLELMLSRPNLDIDDTQTNEDGNPERMSRFRSPAGGMVVRGQFYPGGKLLPKEATESRPAPNKKNSAKSNKGLTELKRILGIKS